MDATVDPKTREPGSRSARVLVRILSFIWRARDIWLGLVGLALSAFAALEIDEPVTAQWFWFAGIGIICIGFVLPKLNKKTAQYYLRALSRPENGLVPLSLFIIALSIRTISITSSPPFVHADEAFCATYGRMFISGSAPLLSIGWFGLPMLSYAISGIGMWLFTDDLVGLRLINAIIGSLGVVLAYALGRTLFGIKAGIIAGIVLVFTFLHAILSRDGIHYIQGPTVITLALLLFALALKHGGRLLPFLGGLALVISLQVYWSARIAFLLVPFLLACLFFQDRPLLRSRVRSLAWLLLGVLISGVPILALFLRDPGSFGGHQDFVFILNSSEGMRNHLFSVYNTNDTLTILANQFWRTFTTFIDRSDASLQIGYDNAIVDPISAILLAAAMLFALFHTIKRWQYTMCVCWFFSVFFSGVLTTDPPWWPRLAAFLPAIALLIGAFLARASQVFQTRVRSSLGGAAASATLILLLLVMGLLNLKTIFIDFPAYGLKARPMAGTLIGQYLSRQPGYVNTLLMSDNTLDLNSETIKLLAPHAKGCTVTKDQAQNTCSDFSTFQLFIMLPSQSGNLVILQQRFPRGEIEHVSDPVQNGTEIIAYKRY